MRGNFRDKVNRDGKFDFPKSSKYESRKKIPKTIPNRTVGYNICQK